MKKSVNEKLRPRKNSLHMQGESEAESNDRQSRRRRSLVKSKISLDNIKEADVVQVSYPITIGTVPFRIPNSNQNPMIKYEHACSHVEGGQYIGPEFLLGQVYDGNEHHLREPVVLYKPVYVTVDKPETKK